MEATLYSVKTADLEQLKVWSIEGSEVAQKELKARILSALEELEPYLSAVNWEIELVEK